MKYEEINQRFTEIVNDYLQAGFLFNTSTMGGSQGETAKVDLTDGKTIVCVVLNMSRHSVSSLYVGICKDPTTPHIEDTWDTIWLSHLEIVMKERYRYVDDDYYVTEEEYKAIHKKRTARYKNLYEEIQGKRLNSEKTLPIARKIIREEFGYKKINDEDIHILKSISGSKVNYSVVYRNYHYEFK